ncbi:MAG: preprotein translocase subunit YajC [Gammaproteobacteria bacterium]|jgi:preprotein translocase subunit YajC|nr:preprotein translocase subunit YajC [Gammaproteobacteria bacterium]
MDFLFPVAYAQEPGQPSLAFNLVLFGGMFLLFWLLILRPQSKRAKEHKELITSIGKGDEVLTSGGLLGKVLRVDEDYLALEVGVGAEVKMQKAAIAAVLPKGTLAKI